MTGQLTLFSPLFETAAMAAVFDDLAHLQGMLDFEAALAAAEADCGVIPMTAVAAITAACQAILFDTAAIGEAAASAGNTAIPLVKALTALVAASDPEAARWVHWGATSQDAMDTGLVVQIAKAVPLLRHDLLQLEGHLAALVDTHRHTVQVARTWMQHALPMTFGLKAAGWLSAVMRVRHRLEQAAAATKVLQFGGAAGTLAALGPDGLRVSHALGGVLGLELPDMPWHGQRDRLVDLGGSLGLLAGTLGKIAKDISLLMQTEVAEVAEPTATGRGGSSAMPHKRNPVGCAVSLAIAARTPALVATLYTALVGEHERSLGSWQSEWQTLPELFKLVAGSLRSMTVVIGGLSVFPERMNANLAITHGLVMAESVTVSLGRKIGRLAAHHVIETASRRAALEDKPLRQILLETEAVTNHLSPSEIDSALTPASYLGQTSAFVARVLARQQQGEGKIPSDE